MRNLLFSMLMVASFLFLLGRTSEAAILCGAVNAKAAACVPYATGRALSPSPACCLGLHRLLLAARTTQDKRVICRCLKAGAMAVRGIQDRFLSKIPAACKIRVGIPVTTRINCETIH